MTKTLPLRSDDGAELPLNARIRFGGDAGFHDELKRRVDGYFEASGKSRHGGLSMYVKTAIILLWFAVTYVLLVFAASTFWEAFALCISLALSVAGIGFAVQHDANHGSYSKSKHVNRVVSKSLDFLGASSYLWQWKHNVFHHTYANIDTIDDDIDLGFLARLAPSQRRYGYHRFQQLYLWVLYGFLLPKWQFFDDFKNVLLARISHNRIQRPKGWKLIELLGGKALFLFWAFALPLWFHTWWVVLGFYFFTAFVVGLLLAIVFQLAHCVEEAEFPQPEAQTLRLDKSWALHQVSNTVDFGGDSKLLTWYLGGLNYQVEHHLFPRISHVHYPRLAKIVQEVCTDFDVRYNVYEGVFGAVASHWRWLRRMGAATP